MTFATNVFVNCPFDSEYLPLLRPLLFTIIYLGLKPRIALEASDAGQARLDKIVHLVRESKFGIHDISRLRARTRGEFYRLNMPFELGLDFGARIFGGNEMEGKRSLILETEAHRFRAALSDLSGSDISHHRDEPYRVIVVVREWLHNVSHVQAPGASRIEGAFSDFMASDFDRLTEQGFSPQEIESLAVPELIENMEVWVASQRR